MPTAAELAGALRGFLAEEVVPGTEGRLSFLARVAANVAASLERELELGSELERRRAERLAALGFADEEQLARAIRAGQLDDRLGEVAAAARRNAVERLALWNPAYVEAADADLLPAAPDHPRSESR